MKGSVAFYPYSEDVLPGDFGVKIHAVDGLHLDGLYPIICKSSIEQVNPSNACLGKVDLKLNVMVLLISEIRRTDVTLPQKLVENGIDVVLLVEFLKLHL